MKSGWVGVDLDSTLAVYVGWVSPTHIGTPIAPMVDRVKRWLAQGIEVRVFTARVSDPDSGNVAQIVLAIQDWCREHIGSALAVTCVKDYEMLELWDDRAVQVEENTGRMLGYSRRGLES